MGMRIDTLVNKMHNSVYLRHQHWKGENFLFELATYHASHCFKEELRILGGGIFTP